MPNAKEELRQVRFKFKKADELKEEYERFKERAEKMTAVISETTAHSNKVSDKVGDNASKMADIKNKYLQMYLQAEDEQAKIMQELNKVSEPHRTLLFMRYVQGLNFETIASQLAYSYTTVTKMHGTALIMYERRNEND